MTNAAITLLGKDQYEELVGAVARIAPSLTDEIDPFMLAALHAVNSRCVDHCNYKWSRAARGVALSLAISAAVEAEQRSRTVAA